MTWVQEDVELHPKETDELKIRLEGLSNEIVSARDK
jgi:hypothetical protein